MKSLWLIGLVNKCLIILLLSFSMPSLASFAMPEDKSFTEQVINSPQKSTPQTTVVTNTNSESLFSLITEFEPVTSFKASKKSIVFNSNTNSKKTDYRAPALMRDSLLFRESVQCNPIYCLVVEFNPPDPAIRNIPDFTLNNTELPWFLTAVQQSNGRLSNWKDGNSLYTSRTTYH